MPGLSVDGSGNVRELADAESSTQPSDNQEQLQHNVGRRRRRPHCDTDDMEDKNENISQPPPRKRCRVNPLALTTHRTAPEWPTHQQRTTSQASPTQRPAPNQRSRHQVNAAVLRRNLQRPRFGRREVASPSCYHAFFSEWCSDLSGEFTWSPCTNHGHRQKKGRWEC